MSRLILLVLTLLLGSGVPGFTSDETLPQPSSLPVEVTALHLEVRRPQRLAVFTGEVVAKQGEITLYCDKLTVFSAPVENQVDRMEAIGNVRVVQLDRTATADQAVYRQQLGTLLLIGNAVVHQGQNQVAGDEITVYLQEDRSVVEGKKSGRVRAILFPEQKKKDQQ